LRLGDTSEGRARLPIWYFRRVRLCSRPQCKRKILPVTDKIIGMIVVDPDSWTTGGVSFSGTLWA